MATMEDTETEEMRTAGKARGTAAEYVLEQIRQGILNGRYAPGQRLIEADLIQDLGIGRSTVREALRHLAAERLVDIVPNRGALVHRLSRREMAELYPIREALEGLAARLAAENIDLRDNRARFADVFARVQAQKSTDFVPTFVEENRRFHETIVSVSGNDRLATLIRHMQLPLVMFQLRNRLSREDLRQSLAEHEIIGNAILAGKGDEAFAAMQSHLRRSLAQILKLPPSAFRA